MKVIKELYPYTYFSSDHEEMQVVSEDVFYQAKDGKLYSQFYKGQSIPSDIYNEVFSSVENIQDQSDEEEPIESESVSDEVVEKKSRKTRRKSIIKK